MNYFQRVLGESLLGTQSAGKVRLVFGARQTGKSTIMRQQEKQGAVFINLQDQRQRLDLERDPAALTKRLKAIEGTGITVLIDEIQKVPSLLDEVQYLYDENPGKYDFCLTGSSARRLKVSSANLLPGRSHLYHLTPLILQERKGTQAGTVLPLMISSTFQPGFPPANLEDMLIFGNLPGLVLEAKETRVRTLESYVELYLEEEIRREAIVRNLGAFQQFLELAAMETGKTINLTAISRESGIPVATLRVFYQVLEDTFVGYRIPAFGERSRKRILTTPKFLFFDLGVRNAAARLPLSDVLLRTQGGQLLENWVGSELVHRCLYAGRTWRVSYWRTIHQVEVDYVLETPEETIPIEVKWTEWPSESDTRHLRLFLNTYSDKAKRGFLVCRCREPLQLTPSIQAIPWQEL